MGRFFSTTSMFQGPTGPAGGGGGTTVGPNSPATVTSEDIDGNFGDVWTNPGNAVSSNNSRATLTNNGLGTDYLCAVDFGFAISGGATITKVKAEAEASSASGTSPVLRFGLIQGGVILGGLTGAGVSVTGSETYVEDDEPDMWGIAITPALLNDPTFGVAILTDKGGGGPATFSVDHIRITVTHT